MNTFVWKGKDPAGALGAARLAAPNAQAARAELERRGWSDLQLVKDEMGDVAASNVDGPEQWKDKITADEEVRYFEGTMPGFWSSYGKTLVESRWTIVCSALILAFGIYRGRPGTVLFGAGCLAVMVILYPVLHLFFSLPQQYYAQLNRAKVWGRWQQVLRCVDRLRQTRRLTRIGPGEVELIRCRAQALAATGKLEEGLAEFRKFESDPKVANWAYEGFVAGIYDCAKQFDKALEHRRRAAELKPDNSAMWIDLAYGLVRGLNRPQEAREALAKAEQLEITQLGRPYLSFLKGVLYWREGKLREAKDSLEKAIPALEPFNRAPLVEGIVLLTQSYLCAVCGALGERDTARKYFRQTEKFLEAGREQELLEACRRPLAFG